MSYKRESRFFPSSIAVIVSLNLMTSCRVDQGSLNIQPETHQTDLETSARSSLQPSILSLANTISTLGLVYNSSSNVSSHNHANDPGALMFNSGELLKPSQDDELSLQPIAPQNDVYNFSYSLINASSMLLTDPDVRLKVEFSGRVEVVEGRPVVRDASVNGTIRSLSGKKSPEVFLIAKTSNTVGQSELKYEISYDAYINFVRRIQNKSSSHDPDAIGAIELLVAPKNAVLKVSKLQLDRTGRLKLEALNGNWDYGRKAFAGDGKVSYLNDQNDAVGADVVMTEESRVSVKLWKRDLAGN